LGIVNTTLKMKMGMSYVLSACFNPETFGWTYMKFVRPGIIFVHTGSFKFLLCL